MIKLSFNNPFQIIEKNIGNKCSNSLKYIFFLNFKHQHRQIYSQPAIKTSSIIIVIRSLTNLRLAAMPLQPVQFTKKFQNPINFVQVARDPAILQPFSFFHQCPGPPRNPTHSSFLNWSSSRLRSSNPRRPPCSELLSAVGMDPS